jgi:hypothetical protein
VIEVAVQAERGAAGDRLAFTIRPVAEAVLGDTVARLSRCGTELYVNTSSSPEDQLWAIGEAVDHLRGLPAPGAQPVHPLRWSRTAAIPPF